ncbi:Leucine-rich repeat, cysteine-containing subtype [Artemisia annua]|uniref:Leucine-rich repeat, cysteine-containing subtype n=1 Tax=Artemisia annua TaxID=35608 RepID=A0A2U1MEA7_ARTAN|nr:Leucine-rich repeat, cysteine-containing subtype [Artemisia annua]
MEQLGDDELTCILSKIPNRDDVKSFSQVSKQFLKVACIRRWELRILLPGLFDDVLPASSNLKLFGFTKPLSNTHMKLLARSCPNLTHLRIGLEQKFDPKKADNESDDKIPHKNDPNSISEISKHFLKVASIHLRSLNVSLPNNVLNGVLPASPSFDFFGFLKPLLNTHTEILPQSCPNLDLEGLTLEPNFCYDDDEYVPGEFEFDDDVRGFK